MNFNLLKLHSKLLTLVIVLITLTLVFVVNVGELKPRSEFEWSDTLGEGGITLMTLVWIFFTLISRPAGKVTVLLIVGLLFMHISMLLDLMDEFYRYPDDHAWLTAYESVPAPIGMILLSIGLYHWHREQLRVNEQLRTRERVYREHGLMDYITGLYSAEYMKQQMQQELTAMAHQKSAFSLLMLDIDEFDSFNLRYGDVRGDQFLREISEFIMYEVRATDLVSRYAGDRFMVLLPETEQTEAQEIAQKLTTALESRSFQPLPQEAHFHCKVSVCVQQAESGSDTEGLLSSLNEKMESLKLSKRTRVAA